MVSATIYAMSACFESSFWRDAAPAWAAGAGTIILAFVAVFQQWLQRLVVRPKLALEANVSRPDAEKTIFTASIGGSSVVIGDVYFFRLAITNTGNAAAVDTQVFLAKVEREEAGKFVAVERFSPLNLKWTHIGAPTLPVLLSGMPPRLCDLAHISEPKIKGNVGETLPGVSPAVAVLALELEVIPNSKGNLLEPGTYKFHLIVAASNCRPHKQALEIVFPGVWYADQETMFSIGFKMRTL